MAQNLIKLEPSVTMGVVKAHDHPINWSFEASAREISQDRDVISLPQFVGAFT